MAHDKLESLWELARKRYAETAGKDFESLPTPKTCEELMKSIEKQNSRHKHFREKQGTLFKVLDAALKPIELVSNMAAGAASAVFSPSQMCFGAVTYLVNAANGVSASLDAITELFSDLKNYTVRLKVYLKDTLSDELREKLAEILVTVIDLFARSKRLVEDGVPVRIKMFSKNVLLGNDKTMQALLSKLQKLTESENLLVGAENLIVTKQTNRAVRGIESSVVEHSAQLNRMAGGMDQILTAVSEVRDDAKAGDNIRRLEALKYWLQPSYFAQDHFETIRRDRVPESGDWVRYEQQMQAWTESRTPLLWISGNPGAGKSFLTYSIVTHLQAVHANYIGDDSHVSVGYFFFREDRDQTRLFDVALRNIAHQITQSDQAYAKYVEKLSQHSPPPESLQSAWKTLFSDYFLSQNDKRGSAFLVLDGIDEAFMQSRNTFFELLNDVQEAGSKSRLHIAMLGRPQIIEEMGETLERSIPTIHLDRIKTGHDIARYVDLSISKSRVLSRVSADLKSHIIKTLSQKAEGMFMWVKLMIVELGKKSRESAIREALNKAPAGLTKMLHHVLETFSATLADEDADDFNNILAWVALAKRPLTLGELDAMLRLQSPEGDAVLLLEAKLRKQYASLFTLTRDDRLSTADLLNRRPILDEDDDKDDLETDLIPNDGLDDVENEVDYNSNPTTTTVSFSHASISDFLRDRKEGKVVAEDGDHPAVGVDLAQSHKSIAETCIDLLTDKTLVERMKGESSLQPYAASFFKQHLDDVEDGVVVDGMVDLGVKIAKLLRDEDAVHLWVAAQNWQLYKEETAKSLLKWVVHPEVLSSLSTDDVAWFQSASESPFELFVPAMTCFSNEWFTTAFLKGWPAKNCALYISTWLTRKEGTIVEKELEPSTELIERAAKWAAFDETAEWHRRVGLAMQNYQHYDAATKHFESAFTLDSTSWLTKYSVAWLYCEREQWDQAVKTSEEGLQLLEANSEMEESEKDPGLMRFHQILGKSYAALADRMRGAAGPRDEMIRLNSESHKHFLEASSFDESLWSFLVEGWERVRILIQESEKAPSPKLSSKQEYYQGVMDILHGLDDSDELEEGQTSWLTEFLFEYNYDGHTMSTLMAMAAVATNDLEWLQSQYRIAIKFAEQMLLPVTAAWLNLGLAQLYSAYGGDDGRAVKIWERIGATPVLSSAKQSSMGRVRRRALDQLGRYLICKALEDATGAHRYVHKMEQITSRHRYGSRLDVSDTIPSNNVTMFLAAIYHQLGRQDDAIEAIKPLIIDGINILSDEDPNNDWLAYYDMSHSFFTIGDDRNGLAAAYMRRRYEDGMAVIESPPIEAKMDSKTKEEPDDESKTEGHDDAGSGKAKGVPAKLPFGNFTWICDGICHRTWPYFDGAIICRYCKTEFCESCHSMILKGELPKKICGKDHDFVVIPYLTAGQTFKIGEVFVDAKAITLEQWKTDVKKKYGIK